LTKELLGEEK